MTTIERIQENIKHRKEEFAALMEQHAKEKNPYSRVDINDQTRRIKIQIQTLESILYQEGVEYEKSE